MRWFIRSNSRSAAIARGVVAFVVFLAVMRGVVYVSAELPSTLWDGR